VPDPTYFALNLEGPTHPGLFYPYYQGQFDPKGELMDRPEFDAEGNLKKGDPLLHWLVPFMADNVLDPNSVIYGYVFLHAGDKHWIRPKNEKRWVWVEAPGE
jgi:hypothetical protein